MEADQSSPSSSLLSPQTYVCHFCRKGNFQHLYDLVKHFETCEKGGEEVYSYHPARIRPNMPVQVLAGQQIQDEKYDIEAGVINSNDTFRNSAFFEKREAFMNHKEILPVEYKEAHLDSD